MGVSVMLDWCVCREKTEDPANILSVGTCPHIQVLLKPKSKLLRAWMSLLQDQSLDVYCTERYGFPS
jgi:hypothetical protein